jgi:hypothetical protein
MPFERFRDLSAFFVDFVNEINPHPQSRLGLGFFHKLADGLQTFEDRPSTRSGQLSMQAFSSW